jgi:hypothetical protein
MLSIRRRTREAVRSGRDDGVAGRGSATRGRVRDDEPGAASVSAEPHVQAVLWQIRLAGKVLLRRAKIAVK